ncbi:hypothetical protein F0562_023598 [Nyssa sinensis]|uniref:Uncharacterized protein n=1 Tax=Nyssa sinensis TaxID=561372 RepID=A0A5J5BGK8_9ASTE|nr:hypothetical protein F0562_023598 [Nyssa sinensis]
MFCNSSTCSAIQLLLYNFFFCNSYSLLSIVSAIPLRELVWAWQGISYWGKKLEKLGQGNSLGAFGDSFWTFAVSLGLVLSKKEQDQHAH